jgi:hypothetical protein
MTFFENSSLPEIKNAPHKKHYYEAAQTAHEEFFASTNEQSDETF